MMINIVNLCLHKNAESDWNTVLSRNMEASTALNEKEIHTFIYTAGFYIKKDQVFLKDVN